MKYTSASIVAATAIIASANIARADTASDIANCISKYNCGNDVNCIAKCMPSAAPTQDEIGLTNICINSSCQNETMYQGSSLADCQTFCINKYFLAGNPVTSTSTSAAETSTATETKSEDSASPTVDNLSNSAVSSGLISFVSAAIAGSAAIFLM